MLYKRYLLVSIIVNIDTNPGGLWFWTLSRPVAFLAIAAHGASLAPVAGHRYASTPAACPRCVVFPREADSKVLHPTPHGLRKLAAEIKRGGSRLSSVRWF